MIFIDVNNFNKILKKSTTFYCYVTDDAISGKAANSIKGLPIETPSTMITPYTSDLVLLYLTKDKNKAIVELYQDNIRVFGISSPVTLKQKYHERGLQIIFNSGGCNLTKSWNVASIVQAPTISELINLRIMHILLQSNVPNKLCTKQGQEVAGLSTYIPDYVSLCKKG